ncbi:MAG: DinB family protein [Planctomycetota bacterium]|nr:DinB family protein [Planctomycetota bacterium]
MPTSNPTDILLAHDTWATRQILKACEALSPEQFHQKFEMGMGTLHDTTLHILAAMVGWGNGLAGRDVRPRPELLPHRTAVELQRMQDEIAPEFAALIRAHPLNEIISRSREGKTRSFTRGAVLTHVATHGMHHRAQCLNMLRHLGVKPLPGSSVVEWTLAVDYPQ